MFKKGLKKNCKSWRRDEFYIARIREAFMKEGTFDLEFRKMSTF